MKLNLVYIINYFIIASEIKSMKKSLLLICFLNYVTMAVCQVTFTGRVTDDKNAALPGVNVFIKGGYDGSSSAADGNFSFTTDEKGEVVVVATLLGFEPMEKKLTIESATVTINFKLREKANELNTVTISAGSFEASDKNIILIF